MSDQTNDDIGALLDSITAGGGIQCGAEVIRLSYDRTAGMLSMVSGARPGVARMYAAWFLTADNRPLSRPGIEEELCHIYRVSRDWGFPERPEMVGAPGPR